MDDPLRLLLRPASRVCRVVLIAAVLAAPARAAAQDPAATPPVQQTQALKVFIDCVEFGCDQDYLRTEITFINHVRDRTDADVHVLITVRGTGGGGREHTLRFIGQQAFAGKDDVLLYVSRQTDTNDERRQGLVQTLKLGLIRYAAATPLADQIQISHRPRAQTTPQAATGTAVDDPWDFWVFRSRINGNVNGERSQSSKSVNGSFSANRTTENWKINLSINGNYRESRFTFSDGRKFININRDLGGSGLVVKSLTDHWSAAVRARINSSTFLNQDLSIRVGPGLEYNIFPYSESTRRQLIFQYTTGFNAFDYDRETIFDKLSETLVDQSLIVSLSLRQPWGQAGTSLEISGYVQDFSKHRVVLDGDIEVRLFKGFTLNLNGSVEGIRDQLFLPKGEATPEEILVRRRQLETSHRYFLSIGVSYTFGSIYNNVVNPRFGGSSGGFRIFF